MRKVLAVGYKIEDFENFLGEEVKHDEFHQYEFITPEGFEIKVCYRKTHMQIISFIHTGTDVTALKDSIKKFIKSDPAWQGVYDMAII